MGERLTSATMRAFRGVPREHTFEFPNGSSAVLYGDNATGKSTVADAIEWYFTGYVDFLRHEGRQHAIRHIAAPDSVTTSVTVETTGRLGGTAVLDSPLPAAVVEAGRETFLLRGRTLVAFIESRKGEKWRHLAEILGLEAVDQLRLDLQRARNELRRKAETAEAEHTEASQALSARMEVVNESSILEAISALCTTAGVPSPASLQEALDPGWSTTLTATTPGTSEAVQLATLASDLHGASNLSIATEAVEKWNEVMASEERSDRIRLDFYRAADALLAETRGTNQCPLCGQDVDEETLAEQVGAVLESLRAAEVLWEESSEALRGLIEELEAASRRADSFRPRASGLGLELPTAPAAPTATLRRALDGREQVDRVVVDDFLRTLADWLSAAQGAVRSATPTRSPRDTALVEIGALSQQARTWRDTAGKAERARRAVDLAERVFKAYERRQQDYFRDILDQISNEASLGPPSPLGVRR
ncbi:MAG: AAA family ATPase [Actinomycetota bacterium]